MNSPWDRGHLGRVMMLQHKCGLEARGPRESSNHRFLFPEK